MVWLVKYRWVNLTYQVFFKIDNFSFHFKMDGDFLVQNLDIRSYNARRATERDEGVT